MTLKIVKHKNIYMTPYLSKAILELKPSKYVQVVYETTNFDKKLLHIHRFEDSIFLCCQSSVQFIHSVMN